MPRFARALFCLCLLTSTAVAAEDVCGEATLAHPEVRRTLALVSRATALSPAYQRQCAGCHGLAGEGLTDAPALPGRLSASDYAVLVRAGRGGMPGFAEHDYGAAELVRDRRRLQALSAPDIRARVLAGLPDGFRDAPLVAVAPIDDHAFAAIHADGLPLWRARGPAGACDGCHSPDGIDLARIGYSPATIMRRAIAQGRSPAEAHTIADYIAALRRRHGIKQPCSPTLFRPLQPRGHFRPGRALDEQPWQALRARGIDLQRPPRDTRQARALAHAIAGIDPLAISLGTPLSRWSSDGVHGRVDVTTAEWLPEIALHAPADGVHHARVDAYLAAPSPATFWPLYEALAALVPVAAPADGVATRLSREKLRASLLFSHFMRTGRIDLRGLLAGRPLRRTPVWETGQIASATAIGCAETAGDSLFPCWGYPGRFYDKMGRDRSFLLRDVRSLVAPWLVAGLLLEPSLQITEGGDARLRDLHQALRDHLPGGLDGAATPAWLPGHQLYLGLVRLVHATLALDASLPRGRGFTQPAVSGCWARPSRALDEWTTATLPTLARLSVFTPEQAPDPAQAARIAVRAESATRMVLLLVSEQLGKADSSCRGLAPDGDVDLRRSIAAMADYGRATSPVARDNRTLAAASIARLSSR